MNEHELRAELERRHLTPQDIAMAVERSSPEATAAKYCVPVQYVQAWLKLHEQDAEGRA